MQKKILINTQKQKYKISINGDATLSKTEAYEGEVITVTCNTPNYRYPSVSTTPVLSLNNTQDNVYQFTMPKANVQVNVSYVKSSLFSVRTQAGTGGNLIANPASAYWGDTVTVTATPNSGYAVNSITSTNVTLSGSGNSRTFIMPPNEVTVSASFKQTVVPITSVKLNISSIGVPGRLGIEIYKNNKVIGTEIVNINSSVKPQVTINFNTSVTANDLLTMYITEESYLGVYINTATSSCATIEEFNSEDPNASYVAFKLKSNNCTLNLNLMLDPY